MFQRSSEGVSSGLPRIFLRKNGRASSKKVLDEEEASQYGDEFLTEESQWNLRSQSSSDFEEDKAENRTTFRRTMPPNGDLYSSITGTTTGVTHDSESSSLLSFSKGGEYSSSYMNILGNDRTSSSHSFGSSNQEYYLGRSKMVSFQDTGYYSSNEYIDDKFDDDDLSYDGEEPFELNDEMLKNLRAQDSPFFNDKVNVHYRDRDHFGIITQLYGSVWKSVIPFCIFNAAWCFVIDYFHDSAIMDLNIPSSGHSFLSILLSFLVVARVQFTYARFMEARGYLGGCFNNFRELYQCVAVLTESSKSMQAKEWREEVALHLVATVRVMVAAVEFSSESHNQDPYDTVPVEFHPKEVTEFTKLFSKTNDVYFQRTGRDKALRSPLVLASTLRQLLLEPSRSGFLETDLLPQEKLKLLGFVTNFCQSVHGLNKLITTPFSFPLVQMSRTILFFWVFTLPMAIMTDTAVRWQITVIIFFVTYGFIGLEYVSIELDDPFGNDPNDFNTLIMAQSFYEDIYLTLYQIDGLEHAENLRRKISNTENFLGLQNV